MFFPQNHNRIKPPFGTPINLSHFFAHGLILSLLFNEAFGLKVFDGSKWGSLGAINGPVWTLGKEGWMLGFDGSGDYVTIYDAPRFDMMEATVSIWFILDAVPTASYAGLMRKDQTGAGVGEWMFRFDSGHLKWWEQDPGTGISVSCKSGGWETGVLYNALATRTSGYRQGYVNAIAPGAPNTTNMGMMGDNNLDIEIGRSTPTGSDLNGKVVAVFVWDHIFSVEKVKMHYHYPYAMYESTVIPAVFGGLPGLTLLDFERGMWRGGVPGTMRGVC